MGGLAAALVALSALTRLPGLLSGRMFNVDEAYLAAMGLTMGRGGALYVDIVDRKPPVLPWIYSLSERFVGTVDLRLIRLALVLVVAATGVVVALIVARLGGSRRAAAAGGALLVLGVAAFPPADAQAANFELFALLPSAAAVLVAISARRPRPEGGGVRGATWAYLGLLVVAGALAGVAGMIKQPFLVVLAPLAWEVWRGALPPGRRVPSVGGVVAGGLAVASGAVASMAAIGFPFGYGEVWRWAWVDTGDFLDGRLGGLRILGVLVVVTALFALLHLPGLAAVWLGRSRLRTIDPVVWFWLAGAAIAVVPGFRFIVHYYLLLAPPLAALAGLSLTGASRRAQRWVVGGAGAIAAGCVVVAALPGAQADRVGPDLVAAVQERTGPTDRIVVWGALPELLWRAERLAGQRFLSVGYLNGKWASREDLPEHPELLEPYSGRWDLFRDDLIAHRPALVVDMTTSDFDDWAAYPPQRYAFGEVLERCYESVGTVEGMALWELTDPSCLDEAVSSRSG